MLLTKTICAWSTHTVPLILWYLTLKYQGIRNSIIVPSVSPGQHVALICRTHCIVYVQSTAESYAVRILSITECACMPLHFHFYAMTHTSTHAHQRISHLAQVVHLWFYNIILCTDVAHQDHLCMVHCKKCLLNCGTIVVFHSIILAIMTVQIII